MFYEIEIKDYVRVDPSFFKLDVKEAIKKELEKTYANHISPELGFVISIHKILEIGEGIIIPGDGAAYYDTSFSLLAFKPDLQELFFGRISEITSFGAFMNLGPIDGMIHISQTMDDFVSFSKGNVLTGRNSKRSLRKGDLCLARIIAVSYKDPLDPKIGITMRQPGLGKLEWLEQEKKKVKLPATEKKEKSTEAKVKEKKK